MENNIKKLKHIVNLIDDIKSIQSDLIYYGNELSYITVVFKNHERDNEILVYENSTKCLTDLIYLNTLRMRNKNCL